MKEEKKLHLWSSFKIICKDVVWLILPFVLKNKHQISMNDGYDIESQ